MLLDAAGRQLGGGGGRGGGAGAVEVGEGLRERRLGAELEAHVGDPRALGGVQRHPPLPVVGLEAGRRACAVVAVRLAAVGRPRAGHRWQRP